MAIETQKWPNLTLQAGQACIIVKGTFQQGAGAAGTYKPGDLVAVSGGDGNAREFLKITRENAIATDLADGTTKPVAVVYENVDATAADTLGSLIVLGLVREGALIYPAGTVTGEKRKILAALREVGIHTEVVI